MRVINWSHSDLVKTRRQKVMRWSGVELDEIGKSDYLEKKIMVENLIGTTQVPLGVAGPLKLEKKEYLIPLATTEGALVASVNRGCKAMNLSETVRVRVEKVGATRAPVFRVSGIKEGEKLMEWLKNNQEHLNKLSREKEKHVSLTKITSKMVGREVWVRLEFDTSEAMGMNMVTIASEEIAREVEKKLGIKCESLSGNYCVDKKPAWLNFIEGRGFQVWAEVEVKKEVVRQVLKVSSEELVKVVLAKQRGSMLSGSLGFNGHFANVTAGIFLATGQDMAHTVEASMGVTTAEMDKDKLYFSIYMPSVMVGTIGGGTGLPTQKEALKLMGLSQKKGSSMEMAKVIGGAVLAGEVSLMASLAQGSLARSHQKWGRGK